MKIQRMPIILFAIAAALGGFVYFHEILGAPKREAAQEQAKKLFPFEEGDIQVLTLKTQSQTLAFKRTSENQPSPSPTASQSSWQMTAPKTAKANEGSIAYLLNLLGTGKSDKTITAPASQQAEFGFDRPLATVDVTLKDQKTHRLVIGKPDFNRSNLYAQVNPPEKPANDLTIQLVSMDFENAVSRPATEWEEKPESKPQSSNQKLPAPNPSTK